MIVFKLHIISKKYRIDLEHVEKFGKDVLEDILVQLRNIHIKILRMIFSKILELIMFSSFILLFSMF